MARLCARDGYNVLLADALPVDESRLGILNGVAVQSIQYDLSSIESADNLNAAITVHASEVDVLIAQVRPGMGRGILDQDVDDALQVTHTNIDATLRLLHYVGRGMRVAVPVASCSWGTARARAPPQAVYSASMGFLQSLFAILAQEFNANGVTLSCLLPGVARAPSPPRSASAAPPREIDPAQLARAAYQTLTGASSARADRGWSYTPRSTSLGANSFSPRRMARLALSNLNPCSTIQRPHTGD